jgi:crotonobetaine/carnitine-CoA ligase
MCCAAASAAATVGAPGRYDGQDEVWAIVAVCDSDHVDPLDLAKHCATHLAYYAVPRYIQFCDQLPRTATNKVTKHELRSAGLAADVWDAAAVGYRPER